MADPPLISVTIPVYNGERYLAEAIDSVLAQTYRPVEVIVVDDGSTDRCAEIVKQYGFTVRYSYQANQGIGAARNRGVELGMGNFIAFHDADDLWEKEKLKIQMGFLASHPEKDGVFCHVKQFHSPELAPEFKKKIHCPDEAMPGPIPNTMLIKRTSFFNVGFFETEWWIGEGLDWCLRATEQGLNMAMLPDIFYLRRLHKTNVSLTRQQFFNQRVRILKASLDRRRKRTGPS